MTESPSLRQTAWKKFKRDPLAVTGLCGVVLVLLLAVFAPLISNQRPLAMIDNGAWSMPFLRSLFAPDSSEILVECTFNYLLLWMPFAFAAWLLRKIPPGGP